MNKLIKLSLFIFGLFGLLKILSIIPFNKMAGDDYSSAIMGKLGYLQSVIATYNISMGRFTAVLIETPFSTSLAYDGKIMIYSIITFTLLYVAILLLIKRVFNWRFKNVYLYLVSSVLFVGFYQLTPNKSESWYWLTGSVVYLWPIILFLFAASYLAVKPFKKADYLIPTVLTFFSVACNEAFGLIVIILLSFSSILFRKDEPKRNLAITMLIASLVSFLIMFLAPGNGIRRTSYGANPMSLPGSFMYAVSEGPKLYYSLISENVYIIIPLTIILSSVFVFSGSNKTKSNDDIDDIFLKSSLIILMGVFLSVVFMLPSFYSLGRVQPDRSILSIAVVIVGQVLFLSYYLAKLIIINVDKRNYIYKTVVFVSSLLLIYSSSVFTNSFPQDLYIAKNYSIKFDAMISKFKEAALSDNSNIEIEVSLPEGGLIADLIDPPGVYSYKNQSLSQYYKIGKVVSVEYEK